MPTVWRIKTVFLSTPSGWRATLGALATLEAPMISIHALRVEGDNRKNDLPPAGGISIHALRVEGDSARDDRRSKQTISIHALRVEGDSRADWLRRLPALCLSTPSGWRATWRCDKGDAMTKISIHALRVEGDQNFLSCPTCRILFLSTPSGWRATRYRMQANTDASNFYPRPPGGGRPLAHDLPRTGL